MASPTSYSAQRRPGNRHDVKPELQPLPDWAHPQVVYWYDDWKAIRDAIAGEKEVKAEGQRYLPQLGGMEDDEYDAYLERSTYYNFTGRTVSALVGTVFRRPYKIDNYPDAQKVLLNTFNKSNEDIQTFCRAIANELLTLSRVGVLVDLPSKPSLEPKAYATMYTAENIVDWDKVEIGGRDVVSYVILREQVPSRGHLLSLMVKSTDAQPLGASTASRMVSRYRMLYMDLSGPTPVYRQRLYADPNGVSDAKVPGPFQEFTPTVRGNTLDVMPFRFFGNFTDGPDVEKPMILDIAQLNLSHYKSYAHLEHGRFYTGLPVYYVENGTGESAGEYTIGPSVVWETSMGSKPGILEFNGQGLKFLENALTQKESQAASLGGRMVGHNAASTAESGDSLKLKERNEQSLLLNATFSLDRGITQILRWVLAMSGVPKATADKVTMEFNKDFLFDGIGSREFRAIQSMYKEGILPIEVVYHYMRKAEVIPEWMELEEFKTLLKSMDSFPNQPDAEARASGFANQQSKTSQETAEEQMDTDITIAEIQADTLTTNAELVAETAANNAQLQAKTAEKTAKTAAAAAAKAPAAGVPGKPGAPGVKPGAPAPAKPAAAAKPVK